MKVIAGRRGSGKTKELIKYCLDHDAAIICRTPEAEQSIKERSKIYFHQIVKTMLVSDLFETKEQNVAIDDIDVFTSYLLKQLFNYEGRLTCATISED